MDVDLERLEAVLIRTLIEALHRVNLKKKVDVERVLVVLVYHIFAYLAGLLRDMVIPLPLLLSPLLPLFFLKPWSVVLFGSRLGMKSLF